MADKMFSKFKLKETTEKKDGEGSAPSASKYFKPGFIFKDQQKQQPNKKDDDFDDDLSDTDFDHAIEMASQQLANKPSTSTAGQATTSKSSATSSTESAALERVNQVASQAVDFTAKSTSTHLPSLKGSNTILVNSNQQRNPLLQNLRSVRYTITDSIAPAHYLISDSCCALFLSLKYHVIHPDYIYERINELKGAHSYQLKILLVMVDHLVFESPLKELTILAVRTNLTMMVAWTYDEAARHIENLRVNAEKPADVIMGRYEDGSTSSSDGTKVSIGTQQALVDALTSVKSVNRTDAATLLANFDSFSDIVRANTDVLTVCPGISMVKAKRLHSLFNKPFNKGGNNNNDY